MAELQVHFLAKLSDKYFKRYSNLRNFMKDVNFGNLKAKLDGLDRFAKTSNYLHFELIKIPQNWQ